MIYHIEEWTCNGCIHLTDSFTTGIVSHCGREFTEDEQRILIDEYNPCPFKDEGA